MVDYNEIKRGVQIVLNGEPYEIIESSLSFRGRGGSVTQARIKNLKTGNVLSYTFHPSDSFEDPDIDEVELKYIYGHKDKYIFAKKDNPSQRYELTKEQIGSSAPFLKANQEAKGLFYKERLVSVSLPIKVALQVKIAPPAIRGERAQAGTKTVVLENETQINVPLFIETGDIVEVNTETGEYIKRAEKPQK